MTHLRWAAALMAITVVAGPAAAQDGKALLGKWQKTIQVNMKDVPVVIEFAAENKVTVTVREFKVSGTYKVVDAKTVEVELTYNGETKRERSEFKVAGNALTLKDAAGKEDKYQKVK